MTLPSDVLLRIDDLQTHFLLGDRVARPVDGVSLTVKRGETLAIVGESGSGKSVTSLSIMRLLAPPGRIVGGQMLYRCRDDRVIDLAQASPARMRALRGAEIAMIFQEPMTSLNPLFTVGDQIGEMIRLHRNLGARQVRERARQMLDLVEIPDAARRLDDYPHQMSGGMRQRVMIAIALACDPALLIADEPTTALDVTVQAQILDLLRRLQAEAGMSILFVTHNMGVVAEIADQVAVMYAGRVIEQAPVRALFASQKHPYTRGLLRCIPDPALRRVADGAPRALQPIPGAVPNIMALPPGCSFAPRCDLAVDRCTGGTVPALERAGPDHLTRCLRHEVL